MMSNLLPGFLSTQNKVDVFSRNTLGLGLGVSFGKLNQKYTGDLLTGIRSIQHN
jgi:hypothetical protein